MEWDLLLENEGRHRVHRAITIFRSWESFRQDLSEFWVKLSEVLRTDSACAHLRDLDVAVCVGISRAGRIMARPLSRAAPVSAAPAVFVVVGISKLFERRPASLETAQSNLEVADDLLKALAIAAESDAAHAALSELAERNGVRFVGVNYFDPARCVSLVPGNQSDVDQYVTLPFASAALLEDFVVPWKSGK